MKLARVGFSKLSKRFSAIFGQGKRLIYCLFAYLFLAIAVVGVITPGLPTTEFVLLSAWCAAKGSPRLHQWLLNHKLFGPMLQDWQRDRTVSRRTKVVASLMMSLCVILMVIWVPHLMLVGVAGFCMLLSSVWLWTRPEPFNDQSSAASRLNSASPHSHSSTCSPTNVK